MKRALVVLVGLMSLVSGCSGSSLRTVTVQYDVRDGLWENLPNGECHRPIIGVEEGQTVTLTGPDGVLLGAAGVSNGTVVDVDSADIYDYEGEVCRFEFTFLDIPEVATYLFATQGGPDFPVIPLDFVKADGWALLLNSGY